MTIALLIVRFISFDFSDNSPFIESQTLRHIADRYHPNVDSNQLLKINVATIFHEVTKNFPLQNGFL